MENMRRRIETFLGLAVFGSAAVGVLALIAALISLLVGQWLGAGLGLIASGLSFGLLSIALIQM